MELGSLLFAILFMILILIYDKYMNKRELAKIKQEQNETDPQKQ